MIDNEEVQDYPAAWDEVQPEEILRPFRTTFPDQHGVPVVCEFLICDATSDVYADIATLGLPRWRYAVLSWSGRIREHDGRRFANLSDVADSESAREHIYRLSRNEVALKSLESL